MTSQEVANMMKSQILNVAENDLILLKEADKTFLRWRAIVSRYYFLENQIDKSSFNMQNQQQQMQDSDV